MAQVDLNETQRNLITKFYSQFKEEFPDFFLDCHFTFALVNNMPNLKTYDFTTEDIAKYFYVLF